MHSVYFSEWTLFKLVSGNYKFAIKQLARSHAKCNALPFAIHSSVYSIYNVVGYMLYCRKGMWFVCLTFRRHLSRCCVHVWYIFLWNSYHIGLRVKFVLQNILIIRVEILLACNLFSHLNSGKKFVLWFIKK